MPKGVLWRQADIFVGALGGAPFGADRADDVVRRVVEAARNGGGGMRLLMLAAVHARRRALARRSTPSTGGSTIVLPDDVTRLDAGRRLVDLAERERVSTSC